MGLRIATPEDEELVVSLAIRFASGTILAQHFPETILRPLVQALIAAPMSEAIVFVQDDIGFLTGRRNGHVAEEIAWYVTPEGRGKGVGKQLLDAFEYWAFMNQCKLIKMTSLDPETGKYFEKNGYVLGEYNYFKEIK